MKIRREELTWSHNLADESSPPGGPTSSSQTARMKFWTLTTIKKGYTFGAVRMAPVIEKKTAHQAEWNIYSERQAF